ncbi:VUT family protein [Kitasatospora cineracea]|uniref:Vitamin uptake transporter n=1 Tax=Kitasatospora cineracea TaxID=88074 RepID=A0A3N4RNG5_9ACTN|nr:VUT family protein [Kitasatospora cineracea]RPE34958.1 hypothetical protein EDD38_3301 [Kitasatospora cineracea]
MHRPALAATTLGAYIATIPAANWSVQHYGLVSVGLGQLAPAGVYLVGIALVLRDAARETAGRWPTAAAILAGAALSYWLATPALALASAAAFGLSEALDMAVYEPLRRRGFITAMAASNAAGLVADSLLFLWLAFGSLDHLTGQLLGKTWMTIAAVTAIALWRRGRAVTA